MKLLSLLVLTFLSTGAYAQTALSTPNTVPLTPAVAGAPLGATTAAYGTVVTGFSADGNYVLGQVTSHFTVGCRGRGCFHTYYVCTSLQWDLGGNLVSTSTPSGNGSQNLPCPVVTLTQPRLTPPSNSVVGNEFENTGGYIAETIVEEICGSVACYETLYIPTLVTP